VFGVVVVAVPTPDAAASFCLQAGRSDAGLLGLGPSFCFRCNCCQSVSRAGGSDLSCDYY
jgi:hypothetical protein